MTRQDSTSYADTTQGRISHIDFFIRADFDARILDVEADYQTAQPLHGSFFLDTVDLEMIEAHVNGRPLEWEFDMQDDVLGKRLHLKGFDNDSNFTLVVRTSSQARALQWMNPSQTAGGTHPFLYSQCQANHARSIFPCQDVPSVRFTYSAEVEVPKALRAVMAAEQGQAEAGSGKFFFNMPQPIPSYLFAIAAGNLAFHEFGPRTGVYAEPETIEAAAWEFAQAEEILVEAEELLGPYLWGRFDMLVLPPSFPFGGMENPRLTFLTPTLILGTRTQTFVVSHELAHAWTGNLVTNASWQDFWLNEGWTTYAEMRITEKLLGKDIINLQTVLREQQVLAIMQRLGMDSAKTCLKIRSDEKDADNFGSLVAYVKGCFFLQECEAVVGRARFDAFAKKYMAAFQFQSITTEMFLDFMKAELPEVFKKVDVEEWVYKPGMPVKRLQFKSHLFDESMQALEALKQGKHPSRAQVKDWHSYQILALLQALPDNLSIEDCRRLEETFELQKRNDPDYFSAFYAACIRAGYQDMLPRIEKYLEKIGRLLYVMPIMRTLIETEWSKPLARSTFEKVKDHHHQITIGVVEGLLKGAGL